MTLKTGKAGGLTRRGFMAMAGTAAAASMLGGGKAFAQNDVLKFWDMPWSAVEYNNAVNELIGSYEPADGLPGATYQTIQWSNFMQTFASALASNTGPALSTGGAFQAFQFAEQGQIAYADNVVQTLRENGMIDDFLPGTVEALHTEEGYVGLPWQIDMRIAWYRKSLLEKAGVEPPTDWASWIEVGRALKDIGVYAFGAGAGPNNNTGNHTMISLMINNGGGLFNEEGRPDALNERNIEAMDFVREMAAEGLIDPASLAYTADNVMTMWRNNKFAIGYDTPGFNGRLGDVDGDILVMSPPKGPHGDQGTLFYVNNLMMYKNNPSQEGTEALLIWYLKNMHKLWLSGAIGHLPVLHSIADTPEFQADTQKAKIIREWQPVGQSMSARSGASFGAMASIDGAQMLFQFTQAMLAGKTPSRDVLATLQENIEQIL